MGVVRLRGCPYALPMFINPPYIWIPPYFQRVQLGYLFNIIKCFPTLEAVMGFFQT